MPKIERYINGYCFLLFMPKVLTDLSIIEEEDPSNVFFAILRKGEKVQPGDLAIELKMAPSSITDNLTKLMKARIVNKPRKEGRKRFYSVNWKNFTQLTLKYYLKESVLLHMTECESLPLSKRVNKEEVKRIFHELEQNNFEEFLRLHFKGIANKPLIMPDTLVETLDFIEDYMADLKKEDATSSFKKVCFEWGQWIAKHERKTQEPFWEAMKKV